MPKYDLGSALKQRSQNKAAYNGDAYKLDEKKPTGKSVVMIPISMLDEFENPMFEQFKGMPQPFRVYSGEKLQKLADSIKEAGEVYQPAMVRPQNGRYQIIDGRNRKRASKLAGMAELPCIIRNMDDTQAALALIHTNLEQRHGLSYSERAYAYRMQSELLNQQGKRSDLDTLCNDCTKIDSLQEVAKSNNKSRRTIAYYIRLTYLHHPLLELIDEKKIGYMAGVYISYIPESYQILIYNLIEQNNFKLSQAKAEEINRIYDNGKGKLSDEIITSILSPKAPKINYTLSKGLCKKYASILPKDPEAVEEFFIQLLELYSSNQQFH